MINPPHQEGFSKPIAGNIFFQELKSRFQKLYNQLTTEHQRQRVSDALAPLN